eukprot:1945336-Pleurochrysis_carterae.AAC.4
MAGFCEFAAAYTGGCSPLSRRIIDTRVRSAFALTPGAGVFVRQAVARAQIRVSVRQSSSTCVEGSMSVRSSGEGFRA